MKGCTLPSYDFEVDLKSLVSAAKKTAEVIQLKKDKDVEDYVPTESALGHAKLQESVNDFQDRWERAINSMTKDLEEISARLSKVAFNYIEYNTATEEQMLSVKKTAEGLSKNRIMEDS